MSILFNGTNPDYLSSTTAPPSSTLSFSCFCYFTGNAIGHKNNIIAITDTANSAGGQSHSLYLYEDTATAGHFVYSNPNGTIIANFSASTVPFNQWVFVSFAVNNTDSTVYWSYVGGQGFYSASAA